jgi:replicative DNA helicase
MTQDLDLFILKTLITDKKHALDFVNECDPKLFSSEYWNFATIIVSYLRTYKEVPTLRVIEDKLTKGNNPKLVEQVRKTWEQVKSTEMEASEYKFQLEKIKQRYAEKQVSTLKEVLSRQEPGSMDISKSLVEMQKTVQSIKGISETKSYERKTLKKALSSFTERFNAKRANPQLDAGLMTGYMAIDHSTNGLKPADFMIIAGESGFGKSLFLNNIGVQVWMQQNTVDMISNFTEGKNVVYFSLEMPYEDCFNRLLARLSGVPSRKIESPHTVSKDEMKKIKAALDFIKNYPYEFEIIDIADACAADLDMLLEDIQYHIDAVFIDYLGIMRTNSSNEEQDWLKQGIVAYECRAIARKRGLPLFSAVQLNRKSNNKDSSENIGLSRLARSATIATHATHVIQIENRPSEDSFPDFLYHLIKVRKGPKGKGRLIKNLACATLQEVAADEPTTQFPSYDPEDISGKMDLLDI